MNPEQEAARSKMTEKSTGRQYFKSKVFIRLFLSYVLLIVCFMSVYTAWYLHTYQRDYSDMVSRAWQQKTEAWANRMDQQLLTAQNLCVMVNTSESCRNMLQTAYVEKKTVSPLELYRMLNELSRIKGSSSNMNVYNLLLVFQGDSKAYSAASVISLNDESQILESSPYIGITSVADLIGSTGSNIMLNKEYLIYAENYMATTVQPDQPAKGTVIVLLEQSGLRTLAHSAAEGAAGFFMLQDDEPIFSIGEEEGLSFSAESIVSDRLTYRISVDSSVLRPPYLLDSLMPVLLMLLLSVLFILVTYRLAKRYYQPIGHIGQMINQRPAASKNEIEDIMEGIRSLIGERNGYREKMVTISPYAQQGMLHAILNGNVEDKQLDVLIDEQFMELRRAYFMLGIINVTHVGSEEIIPQQYHDAQELITHGCQELSTEEQPVVCCQRSLQDLFVIALSDDEAGLENLFYQLYEKAVEVLDNDSYAITIGVSGLENDLERLPHACKAASRALEQMLTGGRRSVYFDETAQDGQERCYYFPKEAHKRMVRAFKEGNRQELYGLLDDLYARNIRDAVLSPSEIRLMVDELHVTLRNALREAFDVSTTHIRIERLREAATIDEIFNYYRHVVDMALQEYKDISAPEDESRLEEEICAYIEANLFNPNLSLNHMADQFGVSTKLIGMISKKRYGQTFLQYVRDRQIHHAVELLQTSDLLLEDIALQCGFTNLLTFRRNFKAVMNMNPSDFRK